MINKLVSICCLLTIVLLVARVQTVRAGGTGIDTTAQEGLCNEGASDSVV